jgi:hypothetical protein
VTVEPLWTGKTIGGYEGGPEDGLSDLPEYLSVPAGTEVAVVPWPLPTPSREQIRQTIQDAVTACVREDGQGFNQIVGQLGMAARDHWADDGPSNLDCVSAYVTESVMALLSGQATEEET